MASSRHAPDFDFDLVSISSPLVSSLHVALQFNWILVAALEDYHAELPDGSRNKKANTVYFNRCAKLLQVGWSYLLLGGGVENYKAWHG